MRSSSLRPRFAPLLIALAIAPACATLAPPPFEAPKAEIHADVAELAWLVGRWTTDANDVEDNWYPAGDALLGASFQINSGRTSTWGVRIVARDEQGHLALRDMTEGAAPTWFVRSASADRAVRFTNPSNRFPKNVSLARRDAGGVSRLGTRLSDDKRSVERPMLLVPSERAPALEQADLAFAAEVEARGTDAWVEAFDPEGAMVSEGRRIQDADSIRAAVAPLFSERSRLQWAPQWSGLSPAGDVGFTIGAWALRTHDGGAWRTAGTGSYVTLWRRQADGSWKVLFDAGEDDPAPATSDGPTPPGPPEAGPPR